MLDYDWPLFRPPSEANSLIFQVTLGCSHNQCLFCGMYKSKSFKIKPLDLVLAEIEAAARSDYQVRRVFLADGDALALPAADLITILRAIQKSFPDVRRISAYASANNLLLKSPDELNDIQAAGLSLIYLGLESGDPKTLFKMKKGSTPEENIKAVIKAKKAGMTVSVMAILGLSGRQGSLEHAVLTAKAVSEMNPPFFSALTLMVPQEVPFRQMIEKNEFEVLTPGEILEELKNLIQHIEGNQIVFRTSHASNYLNLRGILSRDRQRLIETIDGALTRNQIRPDYLRGL